MVGTLMKSCATMVGTQHGSLLGLLRKSAAKGDAVMGPIKKRIATEVCRGMAHLGKHQLVHRDLAARNVLVATGKTAKVADFGQ